MNLTSKSFHDGAAIPAEFALGKPDPASHVTFSDNRNPHLAWTGAPAGTRSFALVFHDRDVPSSGEDVNKEGRTVPASLRRVDFYHWVLVDLPAATGEIAAGAHSTGVTAHGKAGPAAPGGGRHGLNNYTQWFEGDADMRGDYFGYDGPCPPWNDSIVHHYEFTLYALDLDRCPVEGKFTGPDVLKAIEGHVLAKASLGGTYHINPDAK